MYVYVMIAKKRLFSAKTAHDVGHDIAYCIFAQTHNANAIESIQSTHSQYVQRQNFGCALMPVRNRILLYHKLLRKYNTF